MKKTLTINLWGQVFHIDEDAYEFLQNYLSSLENRFSGSAEGKEIMGDVESRIAELLREKLGTSRQVVNMDDVNYAIGIIGMPEDFEETGDEKSSTTSDKKQKGNTKRLYRNSEDRILGGVGGGLAAYFGIDPTIARLLLILTFFISGPLIYIILWLIVPEAQTTAQKLEMSGDPINLSNIEKKIKDEYGKVRDTLKSDKTKRKIKEASETTGQVFAGFFNVLFRSFVVIIGIGFLLLGLIMLFALIAGFFIPSANGLDTIQFLETFFEPDLILLTVTGFILLIGVPVISLIISGIRMIFGIKYSFRILRKTLIAFFICGLLLSGFVAISQIMNYRYKCQTNEIILLDSLSGKTLVLNSLQKEEWNNEDNEIFDSEKWLVQFSEKGNNIAGKSLINIYKSEKTRASVMINRICRHKTKNEGMTALKKIPSLVRVTDSLLTVSKYFPLPSGSMFHFQEEIISINLPVGARIYIPENIINNFDSVDLSFEYSISDLPGKTWVMTEKGLEPVR